MTNLQLDSRCLLSKWGFDDGDMPEHVINWCSRHGVDLSEVDWQKALRALVRAHLLPEIEKYHTVTLLDIQSCHNPIMARWVDGVQVDVHANDWSLITSVSVEVPMDVVAQAIREAS